MSKAGRSHFVPRAAGMVVLCGVLLTTCPVVINLPGGQINVIDRVIDGDILAVDVPLDGIADRAPGDE